MRRSVVQLCTAFLWVPFVCGCGTMLVNLGGLQLGGRHYMEPYGGVKVCLEAGAGNVRQAADPSQNDRLCSALGAAYMLALDLPMSAIADTLTLPWTVRATLRGEARTGPARWDGETALMRRNPLENEHSSGEARQN